MHIFRLADVYRAEKYTKKIGEEEVERRVAYEVSVSKIDLVEDEE